MSTPDRYFERFTSLLLDQDFAAGLDKSAITRDATRSALGVSSLNVILLISTYIGSRTVQFRPAWVAKLEDVEGICSVMREIDELVPEAAATR